MKKSNDSEEILQMIRDIRSSGIKTNAWENNFLESLAKQAHAKRPISERQDEILVELWKRAKA